MKTTYLLAIDFGNTAIKVALFKHRKLVAKSAFKKIDDLEHWIGARENELEITIQCVVICSVRKEGLTQEKRSWIATKSDTSNVLVLDWTTPLPIENRYQTPKTLGSDRLAAVVGANALSKGSSLVIDAGTCITFDFIDEKGLYEGGSISLGLNMRFAALPHFTSKLPLIDVAKELPSPIGKTTREAIQSGVQFGLISEINGVIEFYLKEYPKTKIFACGGDAPILKRWYEQYFNQHKLVWQYEPELVLIGLQRIFEFNEDISQTEHKRTL